MNMMLTVRMAGIFLIFLSSCYLGTLKETQMKRNWLLLREMCEVLRCMEKEMIYHRTPLEEAMKNTAGTCSAEIQHMFDAAAEELRQRNGIPFQEIWEKAVRISLGDLLNAKAADAVAESWTAFCNPDVVLQKTMLQKQLDRLETLSREAEQEYREKAVLYRKLGAAGGIFLIILLL